MSNMLKKIMRLSMMKKLSLCALPCTPVSWRALRACASAVRVREKWRRKKGQHTHHEKHVCAHMLCSLLGMTEVIMLEITSSLQKSSRKLKRSMAVLAHVAVLRETSYERTSGGRRPRVLERCRH